MSELVLDLDELNKKKAELEARYNAMERQMITAQNEISYINGLIDAVTFMKKDERDGFDKS